MTIGFTDGRITTTGSSEQTIIDYSSIDTHFAFWIFLNNLGASDEYRIRVYTKDSNSSTLRRYIEVRKSGIQENTAVFIPYIDTTELKVTIQRTAGTDSDVTWQAVEIS